MRECIARPQAGLVDLLDRVLDRGLVINADIVICLAGVPLIGINLRAALAGMETMLRYGMMKEWDQGIRSQQMESPKIPQPLAMAGGETSAGTARELSGV